MGEVLVRGLAITDEGQKDEQRLVRQALAVAGTGLQSAEGVERVGGCHGAFLRPYKYCGATTSPSNRLYSTSSFMLPAGEENAVGRAPLYPMHQMKRSSSNR